MMLKNNSKNLKSNLHLTPKQKKISTVTILIILLIFMLLITWIVGKPMIDFVSQPKFFREWVNSKGMFSRLCFVGMMAFQVVFAIIPGEPLEIGAGYAFGSIEGTILCVIGITLGSIIVFSLVRKFGVRLVEVFFSLDKIRSLKFLHNEKRLNTITFLIFFIPGTPKDLLSYFIGLTDIKFSRWIIIASLARLPSVITSTVGGNAIGLKNYSFAIIVFTITFMISITGYVIYNYLCKRNSKHK